MHSDILFSNFVCSVYMCYFCTYSDSFELEGMCVIQITSVAVLDSILTLDAVLQQPTIFMLIVAEYGFPSLLNTTFTFLQNESVFRDQDNFSFAKDRSVSVKNSVILY